MPDYRVLCTLPNASSLINGVTFARTREGMLSDVIPAEAARGFGSIRGYRLLLVDDAGRMQDHTHRAGRKRWSPEVFAVGLGVVWDRPAPAPKPKASPAPAVARPRGRPRKLGAPSLLPFRKATSSTLPAPAPAPARASFGGYDAVWEMVAARSRPGW